MMRQKVLTPFLLCFLSGLMLGALMLYWFVSSQTLSLSDLPGGRRSWYPLLAGGVASGWSIARLCALTTVLAQLALWLWLLERSGILAWLLAVRFRRFEGVQPEVWRFGLLAFLSGSLAGTAVQHLGLGFDSLAILINLRQILFKLLGGGLLGYAVLTAFRSPSWRQRVARPAAALGLGLFLALLPWQYPLERLVFGQAALAYGPWVYLLWTALWLGLLGGGLGLLVNRKA